MPEVWVTSDWHFGHKNIYKKFGRPFESLEEMHDTILQNHNELVSPDDVVYMLGDIMMNNKFSNLIQKMNGYKILIGGNHDTQSALKYLEYGFKDVKGAIKLHDPKVILTHYPVHPISLDILDGYINVHGHMHFTKIADVRYFCASLEQIDYRPIKLKDIVG